MSLLTLERKLIPAYVDLTATKALPSGEREIIAYASTWDEDLVEDRILKGAFLETISERFEKPRSLGRPGKIRLMREHNEVIGVLKDIKEDQKGLLIRGKLSKTLLGNDTYELLMDEALDQMSIGFVVPEGGWELDEKTGVRLIKRLSLYEVSVVTFPANPNAEVMSVKALDDPEGLKRFFQVQLRSARVEFVTKGGLIVGATQLNFPREGEEEQEETPMSKLFNLDLEQIEKDAKNAAAEVKKAKPEDLKAGKVLSGRNAQRLLAAVHAMHEVLMAAGMWSDEDSEKPKDSGKEASEKAGDEDAEGKKMCPKCEKGPLKDGVCEKCGYAESEKGVGKNDRDGGEKVGKPDYDGEYHPSKIEDGGEPKNPTADMGKSTDEELEKALQGFTLELKGFNEKLETTLKGAESR